MSNIRRAQQFMPFASLKGYYKLIEEKENEEHIKKEFSDDLAEDLNYKFSQLREGAEIYVKYYKINRYVTVVGVLKYIDVTNYTLKIDEEIIPFNDIYDIWGDSIISR